MSSSGGPVASARTPTAGPVLRLVRGGLLAAATLGVAVWAHASADGNLPGAGGLVVIWALSTAVAAGLLARPASVRRVVALLCAGQGALHLLLSAVAGHGDPGPARAGTHYYATHSMLGGTAAAGSAAATHASAADLTAPAGRGARAPDHRLRAADAGDAPGRRRLVGLWLAAGERALWSALTTLAAAVAAGVSTLLRLLLTAPAPRPTGPRPAYALVPAGGSALDRLVGCPRRGPPGRLLGRPG